MLSMSLAVAAVASRYYIESLLVGTYIYTYIATYIYWYLAHEFNEHFCIIKNDKKRMANRQKIHAYTHIF